jgi:hypothetical protein
LTLLCLTVTPMAHSWYDPFCCNTTDCRPIPSEAVEVTPQGYRVLNAIVPFAEARVSQDADYHVCELPKGVVRCFYAPPGGV